MAPRARLLIAAAACAAVAACGGEDEEPARAPAATATPAAAASTPVERAIAATLERYAQAVRAGDAHTICAELLAPAVLERVKAAGGDCERDLMADRIAEGGPDYRLEVRSISVRGDRATAQTRSLEADGPRSVTQPLVRDGGGWRLSS
jgi:ketosteroid isomerase-like protein